MGDAQKKAREKILLALPHFRYAVKEASEKGIMKLGILSYKDDGSGRVVASFEAQEFFDDLATALGAPPRSEDDMEAKAEKIVQGIRRGIVDLG